ncbi:hypothetical protein EDD16DRAFT_1724884 [Pisolithus croceorrhizus]|nr:hypothetical protein EDD16DRAFT_1724884 [Pisolithus croceorrhizus]
MRYASESRVVMALALGSVVCGEREVVKIPDEASEGVKGGWRGWRNLLLHVPESEQRSQMERARSYRIQTDSQSAQQTKQASGEKVVIEEHALYAGERTEHAGVPAGSCTGIQKVAEVIENKFTWKGLVKRWKMYRTYRQLENSPPRTILICPPRGMPSPAGVPVLLTTYADHRFQRRISSVIGRWTNISLLAVTPLASLEAHAHLFPPWLQPYHLTGRVSLLAIRSRIMVFKSVYLPPDGANDWLSTPLVNIHQMATKQVYAKAMDSRNKEYRASNPR